RLEVSPGRRADMHYIRSCFMQQIVEGLIRPRPSETGERLRCPDVDIMNGNNSMGGRHPLQSFEVESRHPAGSNNGHSQGVRAHSLDLLSICPFHPMGATKRNGSALQMASNPPFHSRTLLPMLISVELKLARGKSRSENAL